MEKFDEKFKQNIMDATISCAKYLEEKAKALYQTDKERVDFILSCAINLVGNFVMQNSKDEIENKMSMAKQTIDNLAGWYAIAFKDYKAEKEMH